MELEYRITKTPLEGSEKYLERKILGVSPKRFDYNQKFSAFCRDFQVTFKTLLS